MLVLLALVVLTATGTESKRTYLGQHCLSQLAEVREEGAQVGGLIARNFSQVLHGRRQLHQTCLDLVRALNFLVSQVV